jgi:hypothetical protein
MTLSFGKKPLEPAFYLADERPTLAVPDSNLRESEALF